MVEGTQETEGGALNLVRIARVNEQWGSLGNMSPHPINWEGVLFPRAEQLFQALRFHRDHEVVSLLARTSNPMMAKMIARRYAKEVSVVPCSSQDVENMRLVLRSKLDQHEEIAELLRATGDLWIVEDCTKRQSSRGLFWGAAIQGDGTWRGENTLGKLWMELRTVIAHSS